MTRNEFILFAIKQAAGSIPGGADAVKDLEGILKRNDNPDDDIDEIAGHVADFVVHALKAYEAVSGKDVIDDEVFAQLAANIKSSIALVQHVKAAKAA